MPEQLSDGILDINAGEESTLEFTGSVSDGAGSSGLSYLSIRLENKETDDSFDLYLYSNDLTNTGEFSLKEDFQWKEGSYRPVSASINDQAGNHEGIDRVWSDGGEQELTIDQIQAFQEKTGIDLSSYTFNFTVKNDNADKSPPQAKFNIPNQLSDGILDSRSGEDSTLEFTEPSPMELAQDVVLSIDLENQETDDRLTYLYCVI